MKMLAEVWEAATLLPNRLNPKPFDPARSDGSVAKP